MKDILLTALSSEGENVINKLTERSRGGYAQVVSKSPLVVKYVITDKRVTFAYKVRVVSDDQLIQSVCLTLYELNKDLVKGKDYEVSLA